MGEQMLCNFCYIGLTNAEITEQQFKLQGINENSGRSFDSCGRVFAGRAPLSGLPGFVLRTAYSNCRPPG
jgi:hypothetical protein